MCVCVCVCVCVSVCLCVCLSVRSISATTSKVSPENDTNASSRQDKKIQTGDFLKNTPFKSYGVICSHTHFVGVRRSCRALQFILTATEAAIATQ